MAKGHATDLQRVVNIYIECEIISSGFNSFCHTKVALGSLLIGNHMRFQKVETNLSVCQPPLLDLFNKLQV